jgi:hypothetical protein
LDLNGGKSVSIEGGVYSRMKRKNMSFLVFIFHPPIAAKSSGLPSFSFGLVSGYYPNDSSGLSNSRPLFAFEELVKSINGFSYQNLLGKGRFGSIYKGCLNLKFNPFF